MTKPEFAEALIELGLQLATNPTGALMEKYRRDHQRLKQWKTKHHRSGAVPIDQLDGLTPRQAEVVRMVADGIENSAIAQRLGISLYTVKAHIQQARERILASEV